MWRRAQSNGTISTNARGKGVQLDSFTFVGALNACVSLVALEEGRSIYQQIIQSGCESVTFVGNSLVDMYAKCGSMEDACKVFNKMSSHNVVSWNAMILRHVKCGQAQKALELFQQIQEEDLQQPDPVTLGGVLNACANVVALKQGRGVHEQIIQSSWESDVFLMSSLVDIMQNVGPWRMDMWICGYVNWTM
jgi:pentatricopeptide repeat protein